MPIFSRQSSLAIDLHISQETLHRKTFSSRKSIAQQKDKREKSKNQNRIDGKSIGSEVSAAMCIRLFKFVFSVFSMSLRQMNR